MAPFQRQLRGSGEDCSQEHVPQSKDTVSRREEEEEDGGEGRKGRRDSEREEELGQLVIHYRFAIIHSGPASRSFAPLPLSRASVSR